MHSRLEVWRGRDAVTRLTHPAFVEQWHALHWACPWATPFQHPAFVNSWYACYLDEAAPVVVAGFDESGGLVGLLPLAVYEGDLVGAGAGQAPYQVWLTRPETSARFAARAMVAGLGTTSRARLRLRCLPRDAPVADVTLAPELRPYVEMISHRRERLRVDGAAIAAALKTKSNAIRLERLRRLGISPLVRIQDANELGKVFDEIASLHDFREGAATGCRPFKDDGQKPRFHLAWMAADADHFHATVLRDGDHVASALLGVIGRDTVHVGVRAYSPLLVEHSLGHLHLMLAGLEWSALGIRSLDLASGGVPPEGFVDLPDDVYEVRVHRARARRALAWGAARVRVGAERMERAAGLEPVTIRAALAVARRARISAAVRMLARWVRQDSEMRVYAMTPSAAPAPPPGGTVWKDHVDDLLGFEPAERWQSRRGFLAAALDRLEHGEHVFTITDGGRLVHYGWLVEDARDMFLTEVEQSFAMPECGTILYDFYTDPRARGRGHYRRSVCHILHELAARGDRRLAYMSVLADNAPSRRVIEAIGFEYHGSLWQRRRFGWKTRWKTTADPAATIRPPASDQQRHA